MIRPQALHRFFHSLTPTSPKPQSPSSTTQKTHPHNSITQLLSSCKHLDSLLQIHSQLITSAFRPNNTINIHLINLYSSFQKPDFSYFIFNSTKNPSVILWNSMIRAYINSNQHNEAMKMYRHMLERKENLEPDKYTFTFALKACTGLLDLQEGVLIHEKIVDMGLEGDVFIGTALVDMYCKTGELDCARKVFDKMPKKDIVAYNAMISGLSQSKSLNEALEFFRHMQLSGGVEPNSVSLLNLLPAVSKLMDAKSCRSIHGYLVRRVFPISVFNGLLDMYSKCGCADVARVIFNRMWGRDDVSWGTMMAGYAHNSRFCEVLELFDQMKVENLKMNKVSAVSALLAAAETRNLEKGMEIHGCVRQQRIDSDIVVATPIMTMYARCGVLARAKELFGGLKERDLIAWSALIAAFAQSGYAEEALSLFREMHDENLKPNRVTLVSVLPACAELSNVKLGKNLHGYAIRAGIDSDILTGTALVSMYIKCDHLTSAMIIFNRMPQKEVVTWNALINGYAQNGDPYNAMEMFQRLQLSELLPDSGTMVGVVPACALLGDLNLGACIHGRIAKCGFESDCHVTNSLIDMYAKCGCLCSAEFLFQNAEFGKDEISWNTIIAGYMQHGQVKEAISSFHQMKSEALQPNLVTYVIILPAAAYIAALKDGMAIHACIIQRGFQSNTLVGNCLIDMYAKCGRLDYSEQIFSGMRNKDTISWNAMLAGYAVNGYGDQSLAFFSLMQESNVEVDHVSFVSILSACRHVGLIEEGRQLFYSMHKKHHLEPEVEHYACMVDLLGRAGLFEETWGLIEKMPMEPDAAVWGALLGACRMHHNVKLGEVAINHLTNLEPENSAHYVVLSSIYSQSGRWGDAGNARLKMTETGLKKNPGCSWVEGNNMVHVFQAGNEQHPQLESRGLFWNTLLEKKGQMGYVSDRSCVV